MPPDSAGPTRRRWRAGMLTLPHSDRTHKPLGLAGPGAASNVVACIVLIGPENISEY
jgi:hypothetical protein